MSQLIEMAGKIFGDVVVLSRDFNKTNKSKHAYWTCQCLKCGEFHSISGASLRFNKTYCCIKCSSPTIIYEDLSGQKFENWIVLSKDQIKNKAQYYNCKCLKCQEVFSVQGKNLKSGNTTQCLSCSRQSKNSKGEEHMLQLLMEHNIKFKKEYIQIIENRRLLFDFVLFNEDNKIVLAIEFDGEQHYDSKNGWFSKDLIERDKLKNKWCQDNNINLIRYRKIEDIDCNDFHLMEIYQSSSLRK